MATGFISSLASDPLTLSRISLLISSITPLFIALNYFRDRATAAASSAVIQSDGHADDGEKSTSFYLKIKIINTGRRSLQLTHFVVRFPRHSGRREVKHILNEKGPEVQKNELDNQFSDFMSQSTLDYDKNGNAVSRLNIDKEAERIIQEHSGLMAERFKRFREWSLTAQNYSLILEEGKALERIFMLYDSDEKYYYFLDPISGKMAIDLFVEDIFGRRYKVKNFRKNIQELFGQNVC